MAETSKGQGFNAACGEGEVQELPALRLNKVMLGLGSVLPLLHAAKRGFSGLLLETPDAQCPVLDLMGQNQETLGKSAHILGELEVKQVGRGHVFDSVDGIANLAI